MLTIHVFLGCMIQTIIRLSPVMLIKLAIELSAKVLNTYLVCVYIREKHLQKQFSQVEKPVTQLHGGFTYKLNRVLSKLFASRTYMKAKLLKLTFFPFSTSPTSVPRETTWTAFIQKNVSLIWVFAKEDMQDHMNGLLERWSKKLYAPLPQDSAQTSRLTWEAILHQLISIPRKWSIM